MKVLVTGGTGFTGGHLCRRLLNERVSVRALVRNFDSASGLNRMGVELAEGDLRDRKSLKRALTNIDVVYNVAAVYRQENVGRKELWDTNVEGTKNLLTAAIELGVSRFVHISTVGVHGNIENPPANENSPYSPGDHYQESKLQGELVALRYLDKGSIPITIIRPCGIYGPGDLRFLKLFKAIKKRVFVMLGSGEVMYHMIYIDDLIDGILLCGTKKEAIGNIYILGGDQGVTLNELVGIIAEVLDVPPPRIHIPFMPIYYASLLCEFVFRPFGINPPLFRRRVNFFSKSRSFEINKAKLDLDFNPRTDLRTGIQKAADWYGEEGLL
jgi:nucleoside-diphosphate-sugar epimerase